MFIDEFGEFSRAIADTVDRMSRQLNDVVADMVDKEASMVQSMEELCARFNQIMLNLQQVCISMLQSQVDSMRARVCFSPSVCCSHSMKLP